MLGTHQGFIEECQGADLSLAFALHRQPPGRKWAPIFEKVTRLLNKVYRRNDGNINSFKKTDLKLLWNFGLVRCQSKIFDLFLSEKTQIDSASHRLHGFWRHPFPLSKLLMTSSLLVVFLGFAQIPLRKRRLRPKATFQRNQWNVAGKFRELNESLYVNIIGKYAKINYNQL